MPETKCCGRFAVTPDGAECAWPDCQRPEQPTEPTADEIREAERKWLDKPRHRL